MAAYKKFDTKSRAAQIAAQKKAAEDAQKAYEASLKDALKHAAPARVEFVENLYSHFEIEAGSTARIDKETGEPVRAKDGSIVLIKTDRNEHVRIEKLGAALGGFFSVLEDAQAKIADRDHQIEALMHQLDMAKAEGFVHEAESKAIIEDEEDETIEEAAERDEKPHW